jgi:hypothetical protein
MDPLTPAERERLHVELAKALGWRMFPYATVGLPDSQQRWCPPGAEVHISTCRDLPSVDELLAALRHERQLRAELEAALQDLLNAIQWWREGGITAEGCQQAEQKARAAINPQPESERE